MKSTAYALLEKLAETGTIPGLDTETGQQTLQAEVRATRKKLALLPTVRESEALPELQLLSRVVERLNAEPRPALLQTLVSNPALSRLFWEDYVYTVCAEVMRARLYCNKDIVKVADQIFQGVVAFAARHLPEEVPFALAILTLLLDKNAPYYNSNGKEANYSEWPFGEPLQSDSGAKAWLQSLKKGDQVDAVKSYGNRSIWSRATYLGLDGTLGKIRFFNEGVNSFVVNPESQLARLGTKSTDYDWRENLAVGDLVDYFHYKNEWVLARVESISTDTNLAGDPQKMAIIRFESPSPLQGDPPTSSEEAKAFRSQTATMAYADDVSSYLRPLDQTFSVKVHSPSLMRPHTKSGGKVEQEIDDSEDTLYLARCPDRKWAILRPEEATKNNSIYFIKYLNTFGANGGFDFLVSEAQNPADNRPLRQETTVVLTFILQNSAEYLVRPFVQAHGQTLISWLTNTVGEAIERNIRTISQQNLATHLEAITVLAKRIFGEPEATRHAHQAVVRLAVLCLRSEILEKQFFGAKKLIEIEEQVKVDDPLHLRPKLAQLLIDEGIFEKIIKGHPNLIEKASGTLKVLFVEGRVTDGQLSNLWETIRKADSESKCALLGMLEDICEDMGPSHLRSLLAQIMERPEEASMDLLKVISAIRKVAKEKHHDDELVNLLNGLVQQQLNNESLTKPELVNELIQVLIKNITPESRSVYFVRAIQNVLAGKAKERNLKFLVEMMKKPGMVLPETAEKIRELGLVAYCTKELIATLRASATLEPSTQPVPAPDQPAESTPTDPLQKGSPISPQRILKFLSAVLAQATLDHSPPLFSFQDFEAIWNVLIDHPVGDKDVFNWLYEYIKTKGKTEDLSLLKAHFEHNISKVARPGCDEFFSFMMVEFLLVNEHEKKLLQHRLELENCVSTYKATSKIIYVPQRPFSELFGADLLWQTFLAAQSPKLFERIGLLISNLCLPYEFAEGLLPDLYPAHKKELFSKVYSLFMEGDPLGGQKAALIIARIITNQERRSGFGLISVGQLKEGDRIRLYYEKEQSYLKQRNLVEVIENQTVFQLKEVIALENKVPFELIGLVGPSGSELVQSDNILTLEGVGFSNLDLLIYRERETEKFEFNFLEKNTSELSSHTKRALTEVFGDYADANGLTAKGLEEMMATLKVSAVTDFKTALEVFFIERPQGSQMSLEEFLEIFRGVVSSSGDRATIHIKHWLISLGFNKSLRPRKYPVDLSPESTAQATRFLLANDPTFYARLMDYINPYFRTQNPDPSVSPISVADSKDAEGLSFFVKLLEILPPAFQDVRAAWDAPATFLDGVTNPFVAFYRSVILNGLVFRSDFLAMLARLQPTVYGNKHAGFLARFLTPQSISGVVRCVGQIADQLNPAEWPTKAITILRLVDRLLKVLVLAHDPQTLPLLKILTSYIHKRRMRTTDPGSSAPASNPSQTALPDVKEVKSSSKLPRAAKEDKDPEDIRLQQFHDELTDLGLTATLNSSINFAHTTQILIDFMAKFIPSARDSAPGHPRLLRALSTALICTVRLQEVGGQTVKVDSAFWETLIKGLTSPSAICRVFFKNTYSMIATETKIVHFKVDLLNRLIQVLGPFNRDELHGLVELTCSILEEIGELKAKNPEIAEYLHNNLNFRDLFDRFYALLVRHESTEAPLDIDCEVDTLLFSYIALIERVCRIDDGVLASLTPQRREDLATFVFCKLLFGLEGQTIKYQKAICKSRKTRQVALEWLRQLLKGSNEAAYAFLHSHLHPFIEAVPAFQVQSQTTANPERRPAHGYAGIKNPGCVCYMIATLQQFYCTPAFRYGLLMADDKKAPAMKEVNGRKINDNLFHQIQWLFASLEQSHRRDFDPNDFCYSYKDPAGEPTNTSIQQDADEFLKVLLERLENSMKGSPMIGVLNSVFLGKVCNVITCKGCGHEKTNEESFFNLSLEVKKMRGLRESLDKLVQEEIISDYMCDRCKKKCDISKRAMLKKLPNVLILSLKKMCFDLELLMNVKIHSRYEFPMTVNLLDYMYKGGQKKEGGEEGVGGAEETVAAEETPLTAEDCEYRLVGVVVHKGNAEFGHYTSLVNGNRGDPARKAPADNVWFEFDDSRVTTFDMAKFEEECFGSSDEKDAFANEFAMESMVSKSAYLLFYEKIKKDPLVFPIAEADASQKELILSHLANPSEATVTAEAITAPFNSLTPYVPKNFAEVISKGNKLLALEQITLTKSFTTFIADFVADLDLSVPEETPTEPLTAEVETKLKLARQILTTLPRVLFKIYGVAYENFKIKAIVWGISRALNFLISCIGASETLGGQIRKDIGAFFIQNISSHSKVLMDSIVTTNDYPLRLGLIDYCVVSIRAVVEAFDITDLESLDYDAYDAQELPLPNESSSAETWKEAITFEVQKCLRPALSSLDRLQTWSPYNKRLAILFRVIKRLCEESRAVLKWVAAGGFLTTVHDLYMNTDADKHLNMEPILGSLLGLFRVLYEFTIEQQRAEAGSPLGLENIHKRSIIRKALSEDHKEDSHEELRTLVRLFCGSGRDRTARYITGVFLRSLASRSEVRLVTTLEALRSLIAIEDDLSRYRLRLILGSPQLEFKEYVDASDPTGTIRGFGLPNLPNLRSTMVHYINPLGKPGLLELIWLTKTSEPRFCMLYIFYLLDWAINYPAVLEYLARVDPPNYLSATVYDWWGPFIQHHLRNPEMGFQVMKTELETFMSTQIHENLGIFRTKIRDLATKNGVSLTNTFVFGNGETPYGDQLKMRSFRKSLGENGSLLEHRPSFIIWDQGPTRKFTVPFEEDEADQSDLQFEISLTTCQLLRSEPKGDANFALSNRLVGVSYDVKRPALAFEKKKVPSKEAKADAPTIQLSVSSLEESPNISDSEDEMENMAWQKPTHQAASANVPETEIPKTTPADFILTVAGRYLPDEICRVSVKVSWPQVYGTEELMAIRDLNPKPLSSAKELYAPGKPAVFHILTLPDLQATFEGVKIWAQVSESEIPADQSLSDIAEDNWTLIFDGSKGLAHYFKDA